MMVDIDYSDMGSYLISISKRIASLEVTAEEMKDSIEDTHTEIKSKTNAFREEEEDLNEELKSLKEDISELSREVHRLVETFKGVARENSMERLERKIKEWAPEDMATHKDLHRNLKKIR